MGPKKNSDINKSALYVLPKDLADRFYERGLKLFKDGSGSAVELERVAKELSKAISFCPDQFKHYVLFGNVYKKASDLSSAIFSYRYALRLDDTSVPLKKLLAQSLSQQGQEILYLAQMSLQHQIKMRNKTGGTNSSMSSPANSRPGTSGGTVKSRPGTGGTDKDEKKTPTEVAFSKDKDGYDVSLFSKALGRFNESLKLENNDWKVWIYKTMCHVRLNENLEALQAVSRAIATSRSTNVEFYILRAKLFWARGLTDDGNRDIRAACTMDPEHPEIRAYIARSYAKAESLYRLGLLAFSEGDYKNALFNLQHALSVSTDDVKLYIMTAKIHRVMGNLQEAYSFIQQAAAIFNAGCNSTLALPDDIRIQTNLIFNDLALQYIGSGEYNKAIVLYNKIIADEMAHSQGAKEPDYRFYVNRGDCYRALTQYEAAIEDYSKGLHLEPSNWDIKTRLSLTYYLEALDVFNRFNDYSTAERLLTFAIKHNPKVCLQFVCSRLSSDLVIFCYFPPFL
jgi:tetratricopeptide (TPR) repeat protein